MTSFLEMDWGAKWDCENLVMYGSKVGESTRKLELSEWGIEEEEVDTGSFNLSGVASGGGNRSFSDLGNASSGRSSISASTNSSSQDGVKRSSFSFEALKGFCGDISMKTEPGRVKLSGASPPLEGSVGSVEPLIGLKLGKRTYFENSCSGGNVTIPSSIVSVPSNAKKAKSLSTAATVLRCQVEGCNLDLSSAKDYHRKHRVCDNHSKCPKVTIAGLERRFCQQCSRFHSLSEFDEKKRSCRRRLSDHNARRRKPQQETIQYTSSSLSSSFYGSRQQMSFWLNDDPLHTRNTSNSEWESTGSSKFTITRVSPSKPHKSGVMQWQQKMLPNPLRFLLLNQPPRASSTHSNPSDGFLELKGDTPQALTQGLKEPMFSSTVDAAQEFRRALSLLSTSSCTSYEPESISHIHPSHSNTSPIPMHAAVPPVLPPASAEYWPMGQQPTYTRVHSLTLNSDGSRQHDVFQGSKASYEEDFYHNPLN